jgi:hypothetical protein
MSYMGKKPRLFSTHLKDNSDTMQNFADYTSLYSSKGIPWIFTKDGRMVPMALSAGGYTRNYIARPFAIEQTLDAAPVDWTVTGATLTAKAKPADTDLRVSGGAFECDINVSTALDNFAIPCITITDPVDITAEYCVSFEYIRTAGSWSDGDMGVYLFDGVTLQPVSPLYLADSATAATFTGRCPTSGLAPTHLVIMSIEAGVTATFKVSNLSVVPSSGLELATVGAASESLMSGFIEWYDAGTFYAVSGADFTIKIGGRGRIKGAPVFWDGDTAADTVTLTTGKAYYIGYDASRSIVAIDASSIVTANRKETYDNLVDLYSNHVILFTSWYDGTVHHVVKENHPYGVPVTTSIDQHITRGTIFTWTGAVLEVNDAVNAKINITGEDCLSDHGLETRVPNLTAPVVMGVYKDASSSEAVALTPSDSLPAQTVAALGGTYSLSGAEYALGALYVLKDDLQTGSPSPQVHMLLSSTYYASALLAAQSLGTSDAPDMSNFVAPEEWMALEPAIVGFVIVCDGTVDGNKIPDLNGAGFAHGVRPYKASIANVFSAGAVNVANAVDVALDATLFDKALASKPTDVQGAMEVIDEMLGTGVDNRVMRFDMSGTDTKAQSSGVTLDDDDNMSGLKSVGLVTGGTAATTKITLDGTTWQFGLDTTVKSSISEAGAAFFATSTTTPIVYGSAASGGNLELTSTSHGTKGNVYIGASGAIATFASTGDTTIGAASGNQTHIIRSGGATVVTVTQAAITLAQPTTIGGFDSPLTITGTSVTHMDMVFDRTSSVGVGSRVLGIHGVASAQDSGHTTIMQIIGTTAGTTGGKVGGRYILYLKPDNVTSLAAVLDITHTGATTIGAASGNQTHIIRSGGATVVTVTQAAVTLAQPTTVSSTLTVNGDGTNTGLAVSSGNAVTIGPAASYSNIQHVLRGNWKLGSHTSYDAGSTNYTYIGGKESGIQIRALSGGSQHTVSLSAGYYGNTTNNYYSTEDRPAAVLAVAQAASSVLTGPALVLTLGQSTAHAADSPMLMTKTGLQINHSGDTTIGVDSGNQTHIIRSGGTDMLTITHQTITAKSPTGAACFRVWDSGATDSTDANPYIEFGHGSTFTRTGWVGFGNSLNTDMSVMNSVGSAFNIFLGATEYVRFTTTTAKITMEPGAGTYPVKWATGGVITYDNSYSKTKDNIRDSVYGLDAILALTPRQFEYKDSGRSDVGFIAEEVHAVIPELTPLLPESQVIKDGEDVLVPAGVNYDRLTSVLVKAVQEQQDIIENLKARIEALEG